MATAIVAASFMTHLREGMCRDNAGKNRKFLVVTRDAGAPVIRATAPAEPVEPKTVLAVDALRVTS
jgi:hypothetical protein